MWGRWSGSLSQHQRVHKVGFSFWLSGYYRFVDLSRAHCQEQPVCILWCGAQIIHPMTSRWINHSAVAIWWAATALVILIWIFWNGKYEDVVNASGSRANMVFTNAARMEKRFQPHRDNLERLFWQHLAVCDQLIVHLKRTQTFSLRSVMGRTFIAPV